MLKIKDYAFGSINVLGLEDGEMAVIVYWPQAKYTGMVVQRHGQDLVAIGMPSSGEWNKMYTFDNKENWKNCRVKILTAGTEFILE